MTDGAAAASGRTAEKDQWLAALNPSLRGKLGADSARPATGGASPHAAKGAAAAASALAEPAGKFDDGPVQVGGEVEILTKEFKPYSLKYGDLKVSVTIKVSPTVINPGKSEPIVATTTVTSKDKGAKGREKGVKQNFSYKDIADRELFDGFDIASPYLSLETAFSGSEVTISCIFAATIVTKAFQAPVKTTLVLVKAKEGEGVQGPGVEIKISPVSFKHKFGAVESGMVAEFKASFLVDLKKIGAEVGKDVLEKMAKDMIKKEAEKQGVKLLGREAVELVLRDLGPLAAAFSVGWDIGSLLNTFTIAPEVARTVDEQILGDLNERYHEASTLGKIVLIHKNLPRIAVALVASGLAGTVAGVSDLVVCKLLHLDKLGAAFTQAFELFQTMLANVPNIGEAAGDMMLGTVITMGIKFNPKYHSIKDPSLAALAAAVYGTIKPLYQAKGGLQKIIDLHVQDIDVAGTAMAKIVALIFKSQLNYAGRINLADEHATLDSFMELGLQELLGFMQSNGLISYKINLGNQLGVDAIDQQLVDEVFL